MLESEDTRELLLLLYYYFIFKIAGGVAINYFIFFAFKSTKLNFDQVNTKHINLPSNMKKS